MEPTRQCFQQKIHITAQGPHINFKKIINLRMFFCSLNKRKRLNTKSNQNSIIWCPYKILFSCFEFGERSVIDLTLKTFCFFISGVISFTNFCLHLL